MVLLLLGLILLSPGVAMADLPTLEVSGDGNVTCSVVYLDGYAWSDACVQYDGYAWSDSCFQTNGYAWSD